MDLWVVAAAAGAGYIAKYWRNLSSRESNSDDLIHWEADSGSLKQHFGDQTDSFSRLGVGLNSRGSEKIRLKGEKEIGVVKTNGDYNVLSLTSSLQGFRGQSEFCKEFDDLGSDFMVGGSGSFNGFNGNWKLRSRIDGNYVKQVKLFKERGKMEEYVFSSVSSPCTIRPLLVTDGRKEIGTLRCEFIGEARFGSADGDFGQNEMPLGVSQKFGLPELRRKRRKSIGSRWSKRLSGYRGRVSGGPFQSQGSTNGMLLFFLGITIGMMSIGVANKREVDKLNELLEQKENLVQDLDEELNREGFESMETNKISFINGEPKDFDDESAEKTESMSKIEAELEAELEKMELNIKTSSMGRIYDYIEGELRQDKSNGKPDVGFDSKLDASEGTTNHAHNPNYAVSPKELSLRLHQVIQSRLEARIRELETELENSLKNVHSLASQNITSGRVLQSELESLPTHEGHGINQPLVMTLSGEALDAYNEAYEEMCRMETDEKAKQCTMSNSESSEKEMLFQSQSGVDGGFISQSHIMHGSLSRDITTWEEETSMSWGSNNIYESDDDDDEMGKLLIKQIVEKARQGFPVSRNAQQIMDDQ